MQKPLYPFKVMLLGLAVAQALAAVWVYVSNISLHKMVSALQATGYLAVPNSFVGPGLIKLGPAFWGGLFFTFTVGAGLSVLALSLAWSWDRLMARHRAPLILFVVAWGAALVAINVDGVDPVASSFFLAVPPSVFWAAVRWMPPKPEQGTWMRNVFFCLPLAAVALIWFSQNDAYLFLDVRDHLLLSTDAGKKINDFYYRYTLYPAEVFKSLAQKTIRTSKISGVDDPALLGRIEQSLLKLDYLPLHAEASADLDLEVRNGRLMLGHRGRIVQETLVKDFLVNPARVLNDFSEKTDRHAMLRRITFWSLVAGLPLALYVMAFTLLNAAALLVLSAGRASLLAGLLCLTLGLALLVPLYGARAMVNAGRTPPELLASGTTAARVAGLRIMQERKWEIADIQDYRRFLTSPSIPERYWLAGALAVSRSPETYSDILKLLNDPQPNVVCAALQALGRRRDARAIPIILYQIKTSQHWYVQWYAYRALKDLGWSQAKSDSEYF